MWWPWRCPRAAPSDGTIPTRWACSGGFGTSRPVKLARCPARTLSGDSPLRPAAPPTRHPLRRPPGAAGWSWSAPVGSGRSAAPPGAGPAGSRGAAGPGSWPAGPRPCRGSSAGPRPGWRCRPPRPRGPPPPRARGRAARPGPPRPRPLLLAQGGVLGPLGLAQVDQARPVAPAPLLLPGQGDDQVAGGDDGIGGDRLVVQPLAGGEDPGQRLLDEVVDRVRVAHPGADHPPEQRLQLQDVLVPGVADRCPDPHGRSLAGMDVRPGGPCAYIHGCRRVMPAAVARSIY
jgi:hypothetical protein